MLEKLVDAGLVRHDEYGNSAYACLRPTAGPAGPTAYVGCGSAHTGFIATEGKVFEAENGSVGQLWTRRRGDEDIATKINGKHSKEKDLCGQGPRGRSL